MSFIFRKSVNLGPFRINLSKNGVGMSVGVPGLRYTMGQKGDMLTASLPGTGLSYRMNASECARIEDNEENQDADKLQARIEQLEDCQRAELAKIKNLEASIAADLPRVIAGKRLQLAWLYYQANQCEDAFKELELANWDHPDLSMSKALLLTRLGRDAEALQCLEAITSRTAELGSFIQDYCGLLVYGILENAADNSQQNPLCISCDIDGYNALRRWLQKEAQSHAPPATAPSRAPQAPQLQATHGKQFAGLCAMLMAMVLIADGKVDEWEFQYLQNRLSSDPRFARYECEWLLDLCRKQKDKTARSETVPVAKLLGNTPVDQLSATDKAEALQIALGMAQSDFHLSPAEVAVMRQSAQILNAALPLGFEDMAVN